MAFIIYSFIIWDKVSVCTLETNTSQENQGRYQLRNSPASDSCVLGLKRVSSYQVLVSLLKYPEIIYL